MDYGRTQDAYWKPLFDGYTPAREWMAGHTPDVAVVVYNDHANAVGLDLVPTFGIGTAEHYGVADEGWGRRPVPPVAGAPELSEHLVRELMDDGFDLATFHRLDVDHGLTVPLSVYCPDPGEAWPCAVVPVLYGRQAICERMEEAGLWLHLNTTKIVYCQGGAQRSPHRRRPGTTLLAMAGSFRGHRIG
jgi:hypothetical protein